MKRLRRHPESKSPLAMIAVVLAALALALAATGAGLVLFAGVLRVRRVVVEGNSRLEDGYIAERSGAGSYRNLLTVPSAAISEKLEEEPWIESAVVKKRLLDTVVIVVTEREPVALLDCNGAGFLVDGKAFAITGARLDSHGDLPRIDGGVISTPRPGAVIPEAAVSECAVMLGGMDPGLRSEIALAAPFDGRGLVLVTRDGFQVVYGSGDEADRKNELLEALLVDIRENNRAVEYVDIRVPDSPVIRFR